MGLVLGALLLPAPTGAAGAELRFAADPGGPWFGTVGVHGLPAPVLERLNASAPAAAARVLAVRTAAAGAEDPAVLGRWWVEDGVLRFEPRFPFRAGLAYRAELDGAALDELNGRPPGTTPSLALRFVMPSPPPSPATRVTAVYPSSDLLPENLLRLYVWFSAPMRRRDVMSGVRLIDETTGEAVELPFVEIPDGLWDPTRRRLTLFVHPGRVKRGVGPRQVLGPPLAAGRRYRLEIDRALRDATGRPLATGHVKRFTAGPPDRRSPAPAAWRVAPPGSPVEPLEVELPEPLDHGLLLRLVELRDAAGRRVPGRVEIGPGERSWSLRPAAPWRPGVYRLWVASELEDPAGNSVARRFEEPLGASGEAEPPEPAVLLAVEIGPF